MDVFLYLRLTLFYKRYTVSELSNKDDSSQYRPIYRNVGLQHHVGLIATTVCRCFSPLTAKCDRFHCRTARKIPTCYGMHYSAITAAVYIDYSFSS